MMLLVYLRTSMDLAIILIRWPGLAGRQAGHDEQTEVPQRARFLESPPRHVRNVISVKDRVLSNKMVTVRQSFRLYEKKVVYRNPSSLQQQSSRIEPAWARALQKSLSRLKSESSNLRINFNQPLHPLQPWLDIELQPGPSACRTRKSLQGPFGSPSPNFSAVTRW